MSTRPSATPYNVDTRLGKKLGLKGMYAEVPAFQIVNDTHDLIVALTSGIIGLKYGPHAVELTGDSHWLRIEAEKNEFNQRLLALGSDAVAAAALADEVRAFMKATLAPAVAAIEKGERPW